MNGNKKKPEEVFKAGKICAVIWKNQIQAKGGIRDVRNVQLEKSYIDKNGNWQKTNSLDINEIAKARYVLQKAFEYIIGKANEEAKARQPAQVQQPTQYQQPQPQVGAQPVQAQQPVQATQIQPPTGAVPPAQAQVYGNQPQQYRNAFAGVKLENPIC